ncbi:hypothetical protein AOQ84DRAFT_224208 [Glonium stellatum]|uniref:Uncharacterized protein n=1 Tax=Glonium stellatum TaxID=574774 RepID=A0A8E2FAV5_9PEZI|nr:hypothetical protein AOQ84DRAFT_224208 [Glonium stellatum]
MAGNELAKQRRRVKQATKEKQTAAAELAILPKKTAQASREFAELDAQVKALEAKRRQAGKVLKTLKKKNMTIKRTLNMCEDVLAGAAREAAKGHSHQHSFKSEETYATSQARYPTLTAGYQTSHSKSNSLQAKSFIKPKPTAAHAPQMTTSETPVHSYTKAAATHSCTNSAAMHIHTNTATAHSYTNTAVTISSSMTSRGQAQRFTYLPTTSCPQPTFTVSNGVFDYFQKAFSQSSVSQPPLARSNFGRSSPGQPSSEPQLPQATQAVGTQPVRAPKSSSTLTTLTTFAHRAFNSISVSNPSPYPPVPQSEGARLYALLKDTASKVHISVSSEFDPQD